MLNEILNMLGRVLALAVGVTTLAICLTTPAGFVVMVVAAAVWWGLVLLSDQSETEKSCRSRRVR